MPVDSPLLFDASFTIAYIVLPPVEVGHMKDIEQREKEYREAKFFLDNTVRHINSFKLDNKEFYKSIAFEAVRLDVCEVLRAALQLQRELRWREEVEKFMERIQHTELNIDNETPGEIFTREHADLLKEGEKWLKETAESCIITAALIVTIVFAAAITVPGGSNQETGIPLFRKQIAFTVFAISDAISLFSAATSLLVFLSIFLNARFAEKDFLLSLPRRLLIALGLLFLSATSMILAFSAILFLVFCDQRPWMLAPIGVCTCIPIAAIVTLQLPLVVSEILGFPSISHVSVSGPKWPPCLARVCSNRVLADVSSLPRMFLGPRKLGLEPIKLIWFRPRGLVNLLYVIKSPQSSMSIACDFVACGRLRGLVLAFCILTDLTVQSTCPTVIMIFTFNPDYLFRGHGHV
ncbi:ankyrin repeat-containing protein, partial [Tanacetum coccineum]